MEASVVLVHLGKTVEDTKSTISEILAKHGNYTLWSTLSFEEIDYYFPSNVHSLVFEAPEADVHTDVNIQLRFFKFLVEKFKDLSRIKVGWEEKKSLCDKIKNLGISCRFNITALKEHSEKCLFELEQVDSVLKLWRKLVVDHNIETFIKDISEIKDNCLKKYVEKGVKDYNSKRNLFSFSPLLFEANAKVSVYLNELNDLSNLKYLYEMEKKVHSAEYAEMQSKIDDLINKNAGKLCCKCGCVSSDSIMMEKITDCAEWKPFLDTQCDELRQNKWLLDAYSKDIDTSVINRYYLYSWNDEEFPNSVLDEIISDRGFVNRWNSNDPYLCTRKFSKISQQAAEFIQSSLNSEMQSCLETICSNSSSFENFFNNQLNEDSVKSFREKITSDFLDSSTFDDEEKVIVNHFMPFLAEKMFRVRFHRGSMMGIDIRMLGKIANYNPRYCSSVYEDDANLTSEIKCFVLTPLFCKYVQKEDSKEDNKEESDKEFPQTCKCCVVPIYGASE